MITQNECESSVKYTLGHLGVMLVSSQVSPESYQSPSWLKCCTEIDGSISDRLFIDKNYGFLAARDPPEWDSRQTDSHGIKMSNFNGFHTNVYVSDPRMSPSLCSELLIVIPVIFCRGLRDHQKTTESARLRLALQFRHGAEDVVVAPPRHVQRLPPLPRRWWEWLEGTCPDRVGGCSPFCPKTLLRRRQTLSHAVSWLCSSQGVAKPRAAYLSSCDTHTLTAVPSLQNTHVAIYLCEAIKKTIMLRLKHTQRSSTTLRESSHKKRSKRFFFFSFICCSTLCQEMTPFLSPKVSVGPWKLRA